MSTEKKCSPNQIFLKENNFRKVVKLPKKEDIQDINKD